ncbi:hypothetical protein Dip518_001580 [Parelusimicrobium proximum]|uniref:LEA type 2 family protein n=1 Tax=Parelusimicrobium proximum TaxID=3228953 RepID=UPI003D186F73
MKRIFIVLVSAVLFISCAGVQENVNMINCKYNLVSVKPVDWNLNAITMDVVLGITNNNKKSAASVSRFEGDLIVNDVKISTLTLKDIRVEPAQTKNAKTTLEVPLASLGKNLTGLVTMGSASVIYEVRGTMYFSTPLGDIPVPVTVYKDNLMK